MLKTIEIKRVKNSGCCERFNAQVVTRHNGRQVGSATIAGFNEEGQAELYQENMTNYLEAYQLLKRGR
jgi:hypothetical protein